MRYTMKDTQQDFVLLEDEINYVSNFIELQKLRLDRSVKLEYYSPEQIPPLLIAPMLLIPFIENAFKHGISLREESLIRISLELKESTLYFDVFNTKHVRSENDPEKNSNGIGLVNVKQRLQLVYPGKHELVIRETANDYFVHLVITLV